MKAWQKIALAAAVALGVYWLLPYGAAAIGPRFAPVYIRTIFWPSAYAFVAGLAGVFLLLILRMASGGSRPVRAVVLGLALGLGLYCLAEAERAPERRLDWYAAQTTDLVALDRQVQALARRTDRPIFYYFRADWCDICPDFERLILSRVAPDVAPFLAVKMDVTDFERWHAYLEAEYGVEATPTVVLRDRQGRLLRGTHFTGEHISVRALRSALRTLSGKTP